MRLRTLAALLAVACASALGADEGVVPCPQVLPALCDDLDQQLREGRRQVADTSGGGGGEFGSPVFKLKLHGGGRQLTQSVTLSQVALDQLATALTKCYAAVRSPGIYSAQLFWDELGRAGDTRCTADESSVPPPTSSVPSAPEPAAAPSEQLEAAHPQPVDERGGPGGLLLDLDVGIPLGVHVGYDFGRGRGLGVRAGVGPAWFSSSLMGGVIVAAFAEVGLGEGLWRIEPSFGAVIVSSSAGPVVGLNVHVQDPEPAAVKGAPRVGFRAGADVGFVSSSAVIMPDASIVLAW